MSDFLVQIVAGVISAVVGALLPVLIQHSRLRAQTDSLGGVARATARSGRGGVAITATGDVAGDIHVHQDIRRTLVIERVREVNRRVEASGESGNASDRAWGLGLLAALLIGVFATQFNIVFYFAIGAIVGIVITAILGAQRAGRLKLWDSKDAVILTEVVLAIGVTIWTWITVHRSTNGAVTLKSLRSRAHADAALVPIEPDGIAHWLGVVLNPIVAFYKLAVAEGQLPFVVSLAFAALVSFLLLALAWSRLNDWYSFLGFWDGKGGERAGKRAARHIDLKGSDIWAVLLVSAVAIFFASGMFVRVWETCFSEAVVPLS